MNVSLPPELEKFVLREVQSGRYPSASEVIRAGLRRLREDKERKPGFIVSSPAGLKEKLLEGVRSGSAGPMTRKDWKRMRGKLSPSL